MQLAFETVSLGDAIRKISLYRDGRSMSYADVIRGWIEDPVFVEKFAARLGASPFVAFFWETPPVNSSTLDRAFEYVEVESRLLDKIPADPRPFAGCFSDAGEDRVASFPNLGGDAQLVVPAPVDTGTAYPHLADFLRTAPTKQIVALWRKVGEEAVRLTGDSNLWISTAGTGVAWLHVRLDTIPKYYSYGPYRNTV